MLSNLQLSIACIKINIVHRMIKVSISFTTLLPYPTSPGLFLQNLVVIGILRRSYFVTYTQYLLVSYYYYHFFFWGGGVILFDLSTAKILSWYSSNYAYLRKYDNLKGKKVLNCTYLPTVSHTALKRGKP